MADDQRAAHDEETPWMHIYGQERQHNDVLITGDRKALQSLLQAVSRALTKTADEQYEPIVCFAADGEGYHVTVVCDAAEIVGRMRLPYSDPYFRQGKSPLERAAPDLAEALEDVTQRIEAWEAAVRKVIGGREVEHGMDLTAARAALRRAKGNA